MARVNVSVCFWLLLLKLNYNQEKVALMERKECVNVSVNLVDIWLLLVRCYFLSLLGLFTNNKGR